MQLKILAIFVAAFGLASNVEGQLTITTSSPLPAGMVGHSYNQLLNADGGTVPYTWSVSAGTYPPGLYQSDIPTVDGTPTTANTYQFTIKVVDHANQTTSKQFSLTIYSALVITTTSPLPPGTVGTSYNQTLAASGGSTPYTWSISSGSLPSGLTLGSGGGITGTPTTAGTASFTAKVTDANGFSTTLSASLTINAPLTITTGSPLPAGAVGTSYNQTLAASGGSSPYTWSISSGSLPSGLTLGSGGGIAGTPTTASTANFTVKVTDNNGTSTTKSFSLTINSSPPTITTSSPLLSGEVSVAYSQTINASGGTTPYSWSVASGSLPPGLSLGSSAGTISGTPTGSGGSYNFTVQVTDKNSLTATKAFSLTIESLPTITTSSPLSSGTVGTSYNQTLAASGGSTPYTWSIISGSLPSGLTLSSGGEISGTPTTAETASFTVEATDNNGKSATESFNLTINPPTSGLAITTASPLPPGMVGHSYNQLLNADGGTVPYTWSVSAGTYPPGLYQSDVPTVDGTPTSSGIYQFMITVTDHANQSVSNQFSLTIYPALVITTTSPLPGGVVGQAYSQPFSASGGTSPYSWTLLSGSLPAGLSLSGGGVLSGTPTASGTASFTVEVTDANGFWTSQAMSLTISSAPTITTTSPLSNGTVGTSYSQTLAASGGTTPYSWSVVSGSLPPGLSFASSSSTISGTPTGSGGNYNFTVQVTDKNNLTATKAFSLLINPASSAPPPSISSVTPNPLQAPTQGGQVLTGTFVIRGQNFQSGFVTTDGPLLLTGSSQVSPDGTSIEQNYQIGCCAPYQGETFHLIVNTPNGNSTVQDTISFASETPSSVSGNILSSTGQAIAGASVQIGSASATSASNGSYLITGLSAGNYPVTVSAVGYTTLSSTLAVSASAQMSQNFTLSQAGSGSSGTLPTVTSITTQYSPNGETLYFLNNVTFPVTFTATVNWGPHPAGTVNFITPNGTYPVSANGGNTSSQTIDVGSAFGAGGQLQVQAVSSDGTSSIATVAPFVVMSALPLQNMSAFSVVNEGNSFEYQSQTASSVEFLADSLSGDDGVEIDQSIPLFGGNDIDLGFAPTLDATINGNHLNLLQVEVSGSLENGDEDGDDNDDNDPDLGMAGLQFDMSNPQIDIFANYDATVQQWQWGGTLGVNGDVNASVATYLPVPIPVPVFASVDFNLPFDATLTLENFDPVTWNGTMDLDPTVTGTLGAGVDGVIAITGWLQGQVPLSFQYPQTPHLVSYQIQLSGGVTAYAFLWSYTDQIFTWDWPQNATPQILSALSVSKQPNLLRPYPRDYLNQPSYGAFNGSPSAGLQPAIHPLGLPSDSPNPLLYALQTGVFPFSEPSISASGTNCYAVWLYDNPSRTVNNQTMLVYSEFNGTNWSMFSPVADDGTADFHPQLRTFADGTAVVAWENEGTVIPTNADFTAMITNLQIAMAFYDPVAGTWQPMQQLTTNNFLDRSPLIDGPRKSNLMLVWVENTNNDLEGSDTNVNQLWFSTYNGSAWSTPQTFATVPYPLLKYNMTYDGTNAYVVMSLDADNTLTNADAHQLYEVAYQNGSWGSMTQVTTNQVPNDNPQMAIDPCGNIVLVWLQGNTLASVVNFNFANQQIVGTNQYSSNLGDFKLANSNDGRLAIVWAAPSPQFPSDLWVMFYDPNFEVWGIPHQLTDDPETEMESAATFYGTNQLIAVYDRADVAIGDTNQIINYGTTITNADLYVLQYQLTNNLTLFGNSLIVSPPNPAPGVAAILSVAAENLGDSAVSNVLVVFYQGDPANGGTEIGQTNISVLMPPGGSNVVSIPWIVPATANPLTVYAVIDPYQQYPQSDLQNEEVNGTFVEPDLAIQAITWGPIASNLLSITATVINDGTIASQPATVSFPLGSLAGTDLFSTNVVGLAPGQSVDVNFIWNVPSLWNGTNLFAVVNPGTNLDFNLQNNALEMTIQPNIAQVSVQFGMPIATSNGVVQVSITGLAGQTYIVEFSTNQLNWSVLTTLTLTNGVGQFFDTSTNDFYQALVFSQAQPQLGLPQLLNGAAQISVTGFGGQIYIIEGSTDLVHWTPIYTNAAPFMFTDPNTMNFTYRFYRAVLP